MLEMRDRLEQEDESPLMQQKVKQSQIGLSDKLTKFIIKYSLYFLILALYIECSMLPVSVLNFVLLCLMAIIVIKYMRSKKQIELYQNLGWSLLTLKWVSLVFIFMK